MSAGSTTNAIRLHRHGGPEVLEWDRVELDRPGPGQVRLRHSAIGVNFIDTYYRTGLYTAPLPLIPGREAAGVVEEVGPEVEGFAPGDRVAYASVLGSYAEKRLIDAGALIRLPEGIDEEVAASVTLQGMTARYLLKTVYPVQRGETILVHAAAGGVGLLLCQWASALGATVIGTVSTEAKAALARAAGAQHTINYTTEDFSARVREITNGAMVPVVYDSVARDTFDGSLDCLAPCGMMVVFGQSSGVIPPIEINLLARKGSLRLTRPLLSDFTSSRAKLEEVSGDLYAAILSGMLRPNIGQRFALRDAAKAHRAMEARKTTGSTLLLP